MENGRGARRLRRRLASVLGLLGGALVGVSGVVLVGSAVAQRPDAVAPAIFEATHLPPLLVLPGEPIELAYDVHCAPAGAEDPEVGCSVAGSVFLREPGDGAFRALPLAARTDDGVRTLSAPVPRALASNRGGLEYYAEIGAAEGGRVTVPSGGGDAPHRVHVLVDPVDVDLGMHSFGGTQQASSRVAAAPWGDGPAEVGLEGGRALAPVGASAFDVDALGNVVLLDQAHRRLLQWERRASNPVGVPLAVDGRLADLSLAADGSIYVLESATRGGRRPLIRRFDADGRELDAVEAAERTSSQIRIGPAGPVVLQQPSNQWMPVAIAGAPVSPARQRREARSGRPLRGGGEVVVLRRDDEIRLAVLRDGEVEGAWRVRSATHLAEVQLAEPLGRRLVVVIRVYAEGRDECEVLLLDRRGLVRRFSVPSADWAESAPLGRFRLVGSALYQLGSDPAGAFVDRYDLGVR
jgi:hypothetical protein